MEEHVPPSPEVAKEQLVRTLRAVEQGLVTILASTRTVIEQMHGFVRAYETAEMTSQADSMRDCPREMDNRLSDLLSDER